MRLCIKATGTVKTWIKEPIRLFVITISEASPPSPEKNNLSTTSPFPFLQTWQQKTATQWGVWVRIESETFSILTLDGASAMAASRGRAEPLALSRMSRCLLLVEFALAALKIALNGLVILN